MRTFYCEVLGKVVIVVIAKNREEALKLIQQNSDYSAKIKLDNIFAMVENNVYEFQQFNLQ